MGASNLKKRYFNKLGDSSTTDGGKITKVLATSDNSIYALMYVKHPTLTTYGDLEINGDELIIRVTGEVPNIWFIINPVENLSGSSNTYYNSTFNGKVLFKCNKSGYFREFVKTDAISKEELRISANTETYPAPIGRTYSFYTNPDNRTMQAGTYRFTISFVGDSVKSVGTTTSITI